MTESLEDKVSGGVIKRYLCFFYYILNKISTRGNNILYRVDWIKLVKSQVAYENICNYSNKIVGGILENYKNSIMLFFGIIRVVLNGNVLTVSVKKKKNLLNNKEYLNRDNNEYSVEKDIGRVHNDENLLVEHQLLLLLVDPVKSSENINVMRCNNSKLLFNWWCKWLNQVGIEPSLIRTGKNKKEIEAMIKVQYENRNMYKVGVIDNFGSEGYCGLVHNIGSTGSGLKKNINAIVKDYKVIGWEYNQKMFNCINKGEKQSYSEQMVIPVPKNLLSSYFRGTENTLKAYGERGLTSLKKNPEFGCKEILGVNNMRNVGIMLTDSFNKYIIKEKKYYELKINCKYDQVVIKIYKDDDDHDKITSELEFTNSHIDTIKGVLTEIRGILNE